MDDEDLSDKEKVLELLRTGPCAVRELQAVTHYKSRSIFLKEVLNPLINDGVIYRDGNPKSTKSLIKMKKI